MATGKPQYTTLAAIVITLNNLADAAARQSAAIDNAVKLFFDAQLTGVVKTVAGPLGADPKIDVYAFGAVEAGRYTYPAGAGDAAIVVTDPTNLKYVGSVAIPAANVDVPFTLESLALAFGGVLPANAWGVVFHNRTGLALAAAGNSCSYVGVQTQSI